MSWQRYRYHDFFPRSAPRKAEAGMQARCKRGGFCQSWRARCWKGGWAMMFLRRRRFFSWANAGRLAGRDCLRHDASRALRTRSGLSLLTREGWPMVTMNQIEDLGQRIGLTFRPDRVVLFGSYAQGTATEDSDVDLLIILPFEGKSVIQSVEIRMRLRPSFPVDLIVRTPEKVRERLAMGDDFMREILEEGKVLYEADRH